MFFLTIPFICINKFTHKRSPGSGSGLPKIIRRDKHRLVSPSNADDIVVDNWERFLGESLVPRVSDGRKEPPPLEVLPGLFSSEKNGHLKEWRNAANVGPSDLAP
uniref:Uncharacterized protein n=1 Tax=Micrurus carvalhoi TaxID=3147026 RepID=A0A2H6N4P7_9SAUR